MVWNQSTVAQQYQGVWHTPHMQRTSRLLAPLHRCAVIRLGSTLFFIVISVWLLSYHTHKSARPLSWLKSLKPSDAYISQWVKPPSVQTMACLTTSLTDVNLLFIGAKEIYFYAIIFEIQTKIYLKKLSVFSSRHQWVRVSLWITCELSRNVRWVIRVSSWLSCTCIF